MKKKRGFLGNKKAENIVLETIIFIVLNLVFFSVMLLFVLSSGEGAFIYEQRIAKQVALIIDYSKPKMAISMDVTEAMEIAKKELSDEKINNAFKIDNEEKKVIVDLSGKGGHSYRFFSDYSVDSSVISKENKDFLVLVIKEKND